MSKRCNCVGYKQIVKAVICINPNDQFACSICGCTGSLSRLHCDSILCSHCLVKADELIEKLQHPCRFPDWFLCRWNDEFKKLPRGCRVVALLESFDNIEQPFGVIRPTPETPGLLESFNNLSITPNNNDPCTNTNSQDK